MYFYSGTPCNLPRSDNLTFRHLAVAEGRVSVLQCNMVQKVDAEKELSARGDRRIIVVVTHSKCRLCAAVHRLTAICDIKRDRISRKLVVAAPDSVDTRRDDEAVAVCIDLEIGELSAGAGEVKGCFQGAAQLATVGVVARFIDASHRLPCVTLHGGDKILRKENYFKIAYWYVIIVGNS